MPAFEYAIKAGVDVLELDLAVTKDNVLVVSHDPAINPVICTGAPARLPIRTTDARAIEASRLRFAEESALSRSRSLFPERRIPTLDEVLALADTR